MSQGQRDAQANKPKDDPLDKGDGFIDLPGGNRTILFNRMQGIEFGIKQFIEHIIA